MTTILSSGTPLATIRSFMNRSSTTIRSARDMLLLRSVPSNFAANEPALSQPAAMASSGFKSITQKISRPPLSRVNIDASHEINGGEVSATAFRQTASGGAQLLRRRYHVRVKTLVEEEDLHSTVTELAGLTACVTLKIENCRGTFVRLTIASKRVG